MLQQNTPEQLVMKHENQILKLKKKNVFPHAFCTVHLIVPVFGSSSSSVRYMPNVSMGMAFYTDS